MGHLTNGGAASAREAGLDAETIVTLDEIAAITALPMRVVGASGDTLYRNAFFADAERWGAPAVRASRAVSGRGERPLVIEAVVGPSDPPERAARLLEHVERLLADRRERDLAVESLSGELIRAYDALSGLYDLTRASGGRVPPPEAARLLLAKAIGRGDRGGARFRSGAVLLFGAGRRPAALRHAGLERCTAEDAWTLADLRASGRLHAGRSTLLDRPLRLAPPEGGPDLCVPAPSLAAELVVGGAPAGLLAIGRPCGAAEVASVDRKRFEALARQGALWLEIALAHEDRRAEFEGVVRGFLAALDARDAYTAGHSERVATAAERTARALRLGDAMAEEVRLAALFHDIGKIGVADATLRKPSRLAPEEVDEMRRHPDAGARILGNVPSFERALVWVRHHHEFFDGSGYPDGLRGSSIPLASRIILVADAFDAMTTDRPYRSGMGVEAASRELLRHAGRQFDPQIVDVFLDLVGARA